MSVRVKNKAGMSLVEAVLALSLGAVVLTTLTAVFTTSLHSWDENNDRDVLISHAQAAMNRMVYELRYATALNDVANGDPTQIDFDTTNLLDDDSGVENVVYQMWLSQSEIHRLVSGDVTQSLDQPLAGYVDPAHNITVSGFSVTALKLDGATGDLVDLGGSPLSSAVAVEISLTLMNPDDGDSVTLTSVARMRNL